MGYDENSKYPSDTQTDTPQKFHSLPNQMFVGFKFLNPHVAQAASNGEKHLYEKFKILVDMVAVLVVAFVCGFCAANLQRPEDRSECHPKN